MYEIAGRQFESEEHAELFYKQVAEFIAKEAIERCPVDTGLLRDSFVLYKAGPNPNDIVIANTCSYAHFVHELVFNYHPKGQAKFLEDAGYLAEQMFGVETRLRVSSVTPKGMSLGSATLMMSIDRNAKGYIVSKRQKDSAVLLERYNAERRIWYKKKIDRYYEKCMQYASDLENGIIEDIDEFNRALAGLERAIKRDIYERDVLSSLREHFGQVSSNAGGPTGDLKDFEKLAVPLSKYWTPLRYNDDIISLTDDLIKDVYKYSEIEMEMSHIREHIETGRDDWIDRVGFFDGNSLDNELRKVKSISEKGRFTDDEISIYDMNTHTFNGGSMKNLVTGRMSIAVKPESNKNVIPTFTGNTGRYKQNAMMGLYGVENTI